MSCALPYDIHEYIILNHISTYAEFMGYLVLVNDLDTAKSLSKRFAGKFDINYLSADPIVYKHGVVPQGNYVHLKVHTIQNPIPFYASVYKISIMNGVIDPALFVNYAHLTDVEILGNNNLDWKIVAKIFPNLRKTAFTNVDNMESAIINIPNLKYIDILTKNKFNIEIFSKYPHIRFNYVVFNENLIDAPNVMYTLLAGIDDLVKYYHIADKIIALYIITCDKDESLIKIPNIFREVTHIQIVNSTYSNIEISGFPNLDTIKIKSPYYINKTLFISDTPYLNRIVNSSNFHIFKQ